MCRSCRRDLDAFTISHQDFHVTCVAEYDNWMRERIIEYKNGKSLLARPLAQILSAHIPANAIVVPVPTTRSKIKARGFDSIGLLSKELTKLESKRRVMKSLTIVRPVIDQVGLGHSQRQQNLAHAFRATTLMNQPVVVIDDVMTTGATLIEARRALLLAGARKVEAAVLCASPQKRYR